jgi:uncharacterized protein YjbI with pentapeptide repeats
VKGPGIFKEEEPRVIRTMIVGAAMLIAVDANAFDEAAMQKVKIDEECPKCDLSGADLRAGEFVGGDFTKANLSGANLAEAVLNEAILTGANLRGADLSDAILLDAEMNGADLTGAKLFRATIGGADLTGAVGLTQAQLDETCDDGTGDAETVLPAGLTLKECE